MQYICNSLYNLEVATTKAYNLLVFAVDPKSDKRFLSWLITAARALLKFVGIIKKVKPAVEAVSAIGTGVYGN